MKRSYNKPVIVMEARVFLETGFLQGSAVSVVEETVIQTAGQRVEDHDFTASGFESTWEF